MSRRSVMPRSIRSTPGPVFGSVCLASVCLALASPALARQAARKTPRLSGEALCVLNANDFAEAGVPKASKPSVNVQDAGASASCVYDGKSAATGGIELDVYF